MFRVVAHSRVNPGGLIGLLLVSALLSGCCARGNRGQLASLPRHKDLPSDTADLVELSDELSKKRPRTLHSASRSLAALDKALTLGHPRTYELLWRLSRASVDLLELLDEKRSRLELGRRAGRFARDAVRLEPGKVEGYYYLAQSSARLAEAMSKMKFIPYFKAKIEHAARLDEAYDEAGPLRFLGKLYLQAPAWPVSVGSPERAVQVLERAVELSPTPLNRLFLGEAYFHDEEYEDADETIRGALADGRKRGLASHWIMEGERYLRQIREEEASPPGSRILGRPGELVASVGSQEGAQ